MLSLVARRIATAIFTLLLVAVLVFFATEVLPGDPANAILGRDATPESLAALREELGLNTSIGHRFRQWFTDVVQGDFGVSITRDQAVTSVIAPYLRNTLLLGTIAALIGVTLSL